MTRAEDLARRLLAYAPADDEERRHLARMRALLEAPGDPFARGHFTPGHFTASAFVVAPDGDALYLIHHAKLHRWLQPGGHVEPEDADILAAARREVAEEVGLADAALAPGFPDVFDVDVHAIPARKADPEHEHFDVRFLFRAPSRPALRPSSEVKDGKWVPLTEVTAELADESVARARRKIARRSHM